MRADLASAAVDLPPPRFLDGPVAPTALQEDALAGIVVRGPWGRPAPWIAAAAAVLLLAVLARPTPEPEPGDRFRGSLDVRVDLVREGAATEQGLVVHAAEGDRLQYRVLAPAAGWITVLALQDDGEVAVWTGPVEVAADQPVRGAVLLDDCAGSERIYFVHSPEPIDADAARAVGGRRGRYACPCAARSPARS